MAMYKSNLGKLSEQLDNHGVAFGEYNKLEKKILELSDLQLDGKMHWMVMTEPDFQRYFLENVKYHLYSMPSADSIPDQKILSCIEMSANSIEKDFSCTFSMNDLAMIQLAFDIFSLNNFENGECSPWSIKPSLNPDYSYDWILWKDDYPVVQYSSKTKQIDPCLDYYDFSLDKFNFVVGAIHQASENGVVPGIMCASEFKNVHSKDSFYKAKDALCKAGLKVDDVQRNGNIMSVKLVARDPDNEYFRYLAKRVNFNCGDGKDLIREAESAGYLMDGDSFCRQQIQKNKDLLDYSLNDLLREAENIVAVFKNAVSDAKEKFINDLPLEVSLDGFRTALDRFIDSGLDQGTCGPWHIQHGKDNTDFQIFYNGLHVVDGFRDGLVFGLAEGSGALTRKSDIPDKSFSELCDMVHFVFPEYLMASFERDKINANNQSQDVK